MTSTYNGRLCSPKLHRDAKDANVVLVIVLVLVNGTGEPGRPIAAQGEIELRTSLRCAANGWRGEAGRMLLNEHVHEYDHEDEGEAAPV